MLNIFLITEGGDAKIFQLFSYFAVCVAVLIDNGIILQYSSLYIFFKWNKMYQNPDNICKNVYSHSWIKFLTDLEKCQCIYLTGSFIFQNHCFAFTSLNTINIAYVVTASQVHMWFSTPHMYLARADSYHWETLVCK